MAQVRPCNELEGQCWVCLERDAQLVLALCRSQCSAPYSAISFFLACEYVTGRLATSSAPTIFSSRSSSGVAARTARAPSRMSSMVVRSAGSMPSELRRRSWSAPASEAAKKRIMA